MAPNHLYIGIQLSLMKRKRVSVWLKILVYLKEIFHHLKADCNKCVSVLIRIYIDQTQLSTFSAAENQ